MGPDVRLLRALVALDAERHFGRAARRVHLSQPALSRQIARLERQIGTPLFRRTSRTVVPTPAGRRLAQRAADALAAIDAAVDEARGAEQRAATVRLGVGETVGDHLLSRLIAVLDHDDLGEVVLHQGWSATLVEAVCRGSLDLVLGHALHVPDALHSDVLALDALSVRLSEAHPRAGAGEHLALDDLAGTTLLVAPRSLSPGLHDHVIACCRAGGFEPRTRTPPVPAPPAVTGVPTPLDAASFALVPEAVPVRDGEVVRALRDAPLVPLAIAWCPDLARPDVEAIAAAVRRAAGPQTRAHIGAGG